MKKLFYLLLAFTAAPALHVDAMAPQVTAEAMSQLTERLKPLGLGFGNSIDEEGAAEYFIYALDDDACASIATYTSMNKVTACITKIDEYFDEASKPMLLSGTVDKTKKICSILKDGVAIFYKFNGKKAVLHTKNSEVFTPHLQKIQPDEGEWWIQIDDAADAQAAAIATPIAEATTPTTSAAMPQAEAERLKECQKRLKPFELFTENTKDASTWTICTTDGTTVSSELTIDALEQFTTQLETLFTEAEKEGFIADRKAKTCSKNGGGFRSVFTLNLQTLEWQFREQTHTPFEPAIPAKDRFAMYNVKKEPSDPMQKGQRLALAKKAQLAHYMQDTSVKKPTYLGPWHVVHGKLVLDPKTAPSGPLIFDTGLPE